MDLIEIAIQKKIIRSREEATGSQYDMVTAETVSRINCEKAILTLDNTLVIHQTPQTERRYDMWTVSGTTTIAIETKDRRCFSDSYEDWALSRRKYDMLKGIDVSCGGRAVWYCNTYQDGLARIWDINEAPYKIKTWEHTKYELKDGPTITEESIRFSPADAKYEIKYDRI